MGLLLCLLAMHFLFDLPSSAPLFADGFLTTSTSPRLGIQSHLPYSIISLSAEANKFTPRPPALPTQPEGDIDTNDLLSQAYMTLTVKELRDLLRQNGAKISGNKRELVDRLADHMMGNKKEKDPSSSSLPQPQQSKKEKDPSDSPLPKQKSTKYGGKRKLLESYNHMTLKELKDILRQNGANFSGNKRELVQRLMTLRYENLDLSQSQSKPLKDPEIETWSILETSLAVVDDSNALPKSINDDDELPSISGLIFVNKPSGWSTLPTKQQLDNPKCPKFPCLSDSVKKWLYNHPDGQQRMKQAVEDEKKWWEFILQSKSHNAKQRKKWRRTKEKQETKMSTFEPRPVHRLDIDTSGIVCIALTPYALRAANMLFEKKSRRSFEDADAQYVDLDGEGDGVQKQYVALVEGALGSESLPTNGMVTHSIGKVWVDDHNEWACDISDDGTKAFIRPCQEDASFVPESVREAVTSYQAVDWTTIKTEYGAVNATRVELVPFTGRGHQLRLHLAAIGHPIVGDDMHGDFSKKENNESVRSTQPNEGRLCLHASKLSMDVWHSSLDGTRSLGVRHQICRIELESSPPF